MSEEQPPPPPTLLSFSPQALYALRNLGGDGDGRSRGYVDPVPESVYHDLLKMNEAAIDASNNIMRESAIFRSLTQTPRDELYWKYCLSEAYDDLYRVQYNGQSINRLQEDINKRMLNLYNEEFWNFIERKCMGKLWNIGYDQELTNNIVQDKVYENNDMSYLIAGELTNNILNVSERVMDMCSILDIGKGTNINDEIKDNKDNALVATRNKGLEEFLYKTLIGIGLERKAHSVFDKIFDFKNLELEEKEAALTGTALSGPAQSSRQQAAQGPGKGNANTNTKKLAKPTGKFEKPEETVSTTYSQQEQVAIQEQDSQECVDENIIDTENVLNIVDKIAPVTVISNERLNNIEYRIAAPNIEGNYVNYISNNLKEDGIFILSSEDVINAMINKKYEETVNEPIELKSSEDVIRLIKNLDDYPEFESIIEDSINLMYAGYTFKGSVLGTLMALCTAVICDLNGKTNDILLSMVRPESLPIKGIMYKGFPSSLEEAMAFERFFGHNVMDDRCKSVESFYKPKKYLVKCEVHPETSRDEKQDKKSVSPRSGSNKSAGNARNAGKAGGATNKKNEKEVSQAEVQEETPVIVEKLIDIRSRCVKSSAFTACVGTNLNPFEDMYGKTFKDNQIIDYEDLNEFVGEYGHEEMYETIKSIDKSAIKYKIDMGLPRRYNIINENTLKVEKYYEDLGIYVITPNEETHKNVGELCSLLLKTRPNYECPIPLKEQEVNGIPFDKIPEITALKLFVDVDDERQHVPQKTLENEAGDMSQVIEILISLISTNEKIVNNEQSKASDIYQVLEDIMQTVYKLGESVDIMLKQPYDISQSYSEFIEYYNKLRPKAIVEDAISEEMNKRAVAIHEELIQKLEELGKDNGTEMSDLFNGVISYVTRTDLITTLSLSKPETSSAAATNRSDPPNSKSQASSGSVTPSSSSRRGLKQQPVKQKGGNVLHQDNQNIYDLTDSQQIGARLNMFIYDILIILIGLVRQRTAFVVDTCEKILTEAAELTGATFVNAKENKPKEKELDDTYKLLKDILTLTSSEYDFLKMPQVDLDKLIKMLNDMDTSTIKTSADFGSSFNTAMRYYEILSTKMSSLLTECKVTSAPTPIQLSVGQQKGKPVKENQIVPLTLEKDVLQLCNDALKKSLIFIERCKNIGNGLKRNIIRLIFSMAGTFDKKNTSIIKGYIDEAESMQAMVQDHILAHKYIPVNPPAQQLDQNANSTTEEQK